MTRRAFFAALFAPFLARLAKWFPNAATVTVRAPMRYSVTDGATFTLSEVGGLTLRLGDSFTIPGYYATNPLTRKPTETLKTFEVTAIDPKRRAITFTPAAIERGQYQNVQKVA